MADKSPTSGPPDSLTSTDRMIDAIGAWEGAGRLRKMFNVVTEGEAQAVKSTVVKASLSTQLTQN
jgi:hypothetical protein